MDTSQFPPKALLRWEFAVRIVLAVLGPLIVGQLLGVTSPDSGVTAALAAALVSLSTVGPDVRRWEWSVTAALMTPLAMAVGALLTSADAGVLSGLFVLVLFTIHGLMLQAGLMSQLAWYPVAAGGMLGVVLGAGVTQVGTTLLALVLGSAWALVLMIVVEPVVRSPLLPIPSQALRPDVALLRGAVTAPTVRVWAFPLLLGSLATGLLVAVNWLTGGYKPYWSVFALVSVLGPTAARTRKSARDTVVASVAGVALSGVLISLSWEPRMLVLVVMGLSAVGALLLLRRGIFAKTLLTPLPVVLAALALADDATPALKSRLAQYLLGVAVAVVAAGLTQRVSSRLTEHRPQAQSDVVS